MPAPFSALAMDLHNTIYDEVGEYGLALDEAVSFWLDEAQHCGQSLTREVLYKELTAGHRRLGSDWDGEVWRYMPSLARLGLSDGSFDKAVKEAEIRRRKKSSQLTISGLYGGVRETLAELKRLGIPVYIVTEASAVAAMNAVRWLKLSGIMGIYSYPARETPQPVKGIYHKVFPSGPNGGHLRKPQPLLLAVVALDEAIRRGEVPPGIPVDALFTTVYDQKRVIPELPAGSGVQRDTATRLVLKETPHKAALQRVLDSLLFVGDSKFKDGLLARNAGVAFGYAAYGKKIEEAKQKSLDIMYATTGWEKEVLKLTQEAGRSETVGRLQPDFTFDDRLSEALALFAQ